MAKNELKLKPCPFCGGRAYIAISGIDNILYVGCEHTKECGNHVDGWLYSSKPLEEQIKGWNYRYKK